MIKLLDYVKETDINAFSHLSHFSKARHFTYIALRSTYVFIRKIIFNTLKVPVKALMYLRKKIRSTNE